jgi:hypothetical protein
LVDSVEKPAAEIEASASSGTVWRANPGLCGRWGGGHRDQLSQLAEVLSGGGEEELVSCAVWTSQAQAVKPQDALEVGEQHLNFFARGGM